MKKVTILTAFVVLFGIFSSNVFAESNPLLTIFEGMKVGIKFDRVENAIKAYGLYEMGIILSSNDELNLFTINWLWLDDDYGGGIAPTANLTVEVENTDGHRRIKSATYDYSFLDFERELKLAPELRTELTFEETMNEIAKDLAELNKVIQGAQKSAEKGITHIEEMKMLINKEIQRLIEELRQELKK